MKTDAGVAPENLLGHCVHQTTAIMISTTPDSMRQTGIAATLRATEVFAGLDEKDIAAIAGIAQIRSFKKGQYVMREGELLGGFNIIRTGQINVHQDNGNGRKHIVHVVGPLYCFGAHSLATARPTSVSGTALQSTQVIFLPKEPFLKLMALSPEIPLRIIASMALQVRILLANIYHTKVCQAKTRLARWLAHKLTLRPDIHGGEASTVTLEISKKLLAEKLGMTKETLSRTLTHFHKEGVVKVIKKQIHVLDVQLLRAYANKG